jgi:hypothetical protein
VTSTLADALEQAKTAPADFALSGLAVLRDELDRTDAGIAGWERYLSEHPGNAIAERQLRWEHSHRRKVARDLERLERANQATPGVWERLARRYEAL